MPDTTLPSAGLLPKYIDPTNREYTIYHDSLRTFNSGIQDRLKRLLLAATEYHEGIVYTTTGSDGRFEKGPQSKVELLVIKSGATVGANQISTVEQLIRDKSLRDTFGYFEVKDVDNEVMSYFSNNPQSVFPTIVLDASFLAGDYIVLRRCFEKLLQEFGGPLGARIKGHMKTLKFRAKKIMATGIGTFRGEDIKHYDLNGGVAFFSNSNDRDVHAASFKYGPLRFVQYSVADNVVKYFARNPNLNFLQVFPTNTVERILTLESEGLTKLSHEQVAELVDTYKFFLWLFHLSQFNFKEKQQTETSFDRQEVSERIKSLERILTNGIIPLS